MLKLILKSMCTDVIFHVRYLSEVITDIKKVSPSILRTSDDRPQKKILQGELIWNTWNVGVFKSQIQELHFYSPTPLK